MLAATPRREYAISSVNASQDYAFMLLVILEYATSKIATASKIEVGTVGDITYCKTTAGCSMKCILTFPTRL